MTGAMYAAVAGLRTHMSALNVISHNVANVNTMAYKATRYTFNEALYLTVRAGSNGNRQMGGQNTAQVGYGASIGTIDLDMSTKNYSPTGKAMDCMIDGDGFFVLGDNKTTTGVIRESELQGMTLSRLGNFEFDANGYLVDGNGSLVYGFLRTTSLEDATRGMTEEEAEAVQEEDLTSPILTPVRLPMCTVTSSRRTDDLNYGSDDQEDVPGAKLYTNIIWPSTTEEGTVEDGESEIEGVVAQRLQPNSVSVDKTGLITAVTKDKQVVIVGFIAIASVDNPNGVTHIDGRYYQALGGAGTVRLSTIGGAFTYLPPTGDDAGNQEGLYSELRVEASGGTELVPNGLESSGTDLANEITNMIVIQRGYQANTRIVTVTDSMLEELVNMKR